MIYGIQTLLQISDKFNFDTFKLYLEEDSNDTISNLMPKIIFLSENTSLINGNSAVL